MGVKIRVNALSISDMVKARNEVLKYRIQIARKCDRFVKTLANNGIIVAQENVGDEFANYITFSQEITEHAQYGCKGVMFATNNGMIKSEWQLADGTIRQEDVSPLLMAEFGSGLRAERSKNTWSSKLGMGTGTFPNQTHAWDPDGWWYKDLDGEWHHSYGVYASMPMWNAYAEMKEQVIATAREVFST